jgi:hypothetical protein
MTWHINVVLQDSKRSKSAGPVFCATHVALPKPRRENIMIGVTNWTKIFPSCKPHFLHYLRIANGPRQWAYSTRWHLQYLNWRPCRLVWVHIFRIWSRSIQCTCNLQMKSMWPVTYIHRPSSPFFSFFEIGNEAPASTSSDAHSYFYCKVQSI